MNSCLQCYREIKEGEGITVELEPGIKASFCDKICERIQRDFWKSRENIRNDNAGNMASEDW